MIAMLERFYDPTTGSITIDSTPLPVLNPRLFRGIVALIQQEPTLFQGTIRENIALGLNDPDATSTTPPADSTIEDALRAANAWDFVSSLPEGLSTQAGANGTQLSGGQRQRIAIARSIVRKPKLLILDEATSAIDVRGEKIVQAALDRVAQGRTTITIAHRLSTIKKADRIVVLKKGQVAEIGTHQSLLEDPAGVYAGLVQAQKLNLGEGVAADSDEEEGVEGEKGLSAALSREKSVTNEEGEAAPPSKGDKKVRNFANSFGRLLVEQRSRWPYYILTIFFAACVGGKVTHEPTKSLSP